MNLMIQPNQICLIVKLYNNRPELLPDSNDKFSQIQLSRGNLIIAIQIANNFVKELINIKRLTGAPEIWSPDNDIFK